MESLSKKWVRHFLPINQVSAISGQTYGPGLIDLLYVTAPLHNWVSLSTIEGVTREERLGKKHSACSVWEFLIDHIHPISQYATSILSDALRRESIAGMYVTNPEDLIDELWEIFRAIPEQENIRVFQNSIDQYKWIAQHDRDCYRASEENGRLILK
jgi:hypothetical protein